MPLYATAHWWHRAVGRHLPVPFLGQRQAAPDMGGPDHLLLHCNHRRPSFHRSSSLDLSPSRKPSHRHRHPIFCLQPLPVLVLALRPSRRLCQRQSRQRASTPQPFVRRRHLDRAESAPTLRHRQNPSSFLRQGTVCSPSDFSAAIRGPSVVILATAASSRSNSCLCAGPRLPPRAILMPS